MKRSIRKGSFHVHATYENGGFSNNLFGEKITLEREGDNITLEFDMTKNLRIRNKSSNTYVDMREFQEKFRRLEFMQLDSKLIEDPLATAWKSSDDPNVYLKIKISDTEHAIFRVNPKSRSGVLQLDVLEVVDA